MGFPARSLFTRCRRVNSSGNSRLRLGSGLPNWGDAEKARQILALLPSLPEEAFESATEALLLNPKTEVPGCLLALFKIFVVPKKRATATGSGPQAAEPSSLFTARNSKHKDSGGSREGEWGGGAESLLKITECQGFAHPHTRAFRCNFGFGVNPRSRGRVLSALFADLLGRRDGVVRPALIAISKTPGHPLKPAARGNLELLLGKNVGGNWS